MAVSPRSAAHKSVQQALLGQEKEHLERALNERDRRVLQLNKSNEQFAEQVHQLKALVKDAHVRYEDDLQRTVSSLQEQYNAAVELLQVRRALSEHDDLDAQRPGLSGSKSAATGFPSGPGPGIASSATGSQVPRPNGHCHQRTQQAALSGTCRCGGTGRHACGSKSTAARLKKVELDPRFGLLGLDPDDLAPSTAYGASVGLVTEPVSVLRDVLNLDGIHDHDRQDQRGRPTSTGAEVAGVSGPLLAQARFESRLRGAYRSMLLQLQHRYQLEKERQEDRHKLELQEQEERHCHELSHLAAVHEEELAKAAGRAEREAAVWEGDVKRLQAQLAAAKAAAEASQSQVTAAKAAVEALQAQLQLMRSAHEAELQHVRQGSVSLQHHEEVVRQLKAEWNEALQQRERDYNALLAELTGLRRQLSSTAELSRSSGNSCGHGSGSVSPCKGSQANPAPAASRPTALPHSDNPWNAVAGGAPQLGQQVCAGAGTFHMEQHVPPLPNQQAQTSQMLRWLMDGHNVTGGEGCRGAGLRAAGSRSGGERAPDSPAGSAQSDALSLNKNGGAILNVSVDDDATPRSRGTHAQGGNGVPPHLTSAAPDADPSRPPSSASSRLSDMVDALVHGGLPRITTNTSSNPDGDDNSHGRAIRKPVVGGAGAPDAPLSLWTCPDERRPSATPAGGLDARHSRGTTAIASGEEGDVSGSHGSGRAAGGVSVARRSPDEGCSMTAPGSPDRHSSSEVTLDNWQLGPAAVANSIGGGPAPREPQKLLAQDGGARPQAASSGVERRQAAGLSRQRAGGGRERSPSVSPVRVGPRAAGDTSGEGRAGPAAPARVAPSPWGGNSGNPAAAVHVPRCLRCGLNDATSPGCCRFHPALLSDPGSLRFTPEWMTCHAADHTARTPGCFIRSEHFYEPVRYPAPARSGPKVEARTGAAQPSDEGGHTADDPGGLSNLRRRSSSGLGTSAVGQAAGSRKAVWGRAISPPGHSGRMAGPARVADAGRKSRSPGRGVGACGAVSGGATMSPAGSDSPSPQPRTRLPSPLRR